MSEKHNKRWLEVIRKAKEAGLDDDEIINSIESRAMLKIQEKQAPPGKDLIITHLPGTSLDTSRKELRSLTRRARELGIFSGYYEEWEIAQFANAIVQRRDIQWAEMVTEDLIPVFSYFLTLTNLLNDIAGYVRRSPGNLWAETKQKERVYPFDETHAGDLSKAWTELSIIAEKMGIPNEAVPNVKAFVLGIRNLINGHDNGESLRDAVNQYAPCDDILLKFLENFKMPPKLGPKLKDEIGWLCEQAVMIQQSERISQADAAEKLFLKLYEGHENNRLQDIEIRAWQKMEEWDRRGGYSENLWRNVRRRDIGHTDPDSTRT